MRRYAVWASVLAAAAVLVLNAQGWWALERTSRAFEQELGARLEAVATTLSAALGGRWDTPGAERLLREVRAENGLLNIFIVDEGLAVRLSLADDSSGAGVAADRAGLYAALAGVPGQSPVLRAGRLYLKSAYAPLDDSTGAVGAALGVEADARFFATLADFRRGLALVNVVSCIAIAGIVLASASLARHALRVEQAAARASRLALAGQMAAAMAHEVRNPLATIRSTAERLRKQYGAGGADPKFGYIEDEVDRLDRVVANYLGISRSRPGDAEPIDAGELVREVAHSLAVEAARSGVAVAAEAEQGLPPVAGARDELRQVLLNLGLNGVQAQPGGGRVLFGARARRGEVVLRVTDDGPGVDERTARRMFEPFFTTREKGSGLGLFVVRRIVEAHGGRVRLANPGRPGAEIEVSLPAKGGAA
ncbi:MAG: HAMP domain-containing sensor histidine kinase [bacterium]